MERTYQSTYQRSGVRRNSRARTRRSREHQAEEKRISFEKKLAIQAVAGILVFVSVWGFGAFGGEFGKWMENQVKYALTYQVDFQTAYLSAREMTTYLSSFLVKRDTDSPAQPANGLAVESSPLPTSLPTPSAEPSAEPTPESSGSSPESGL